MTIDYEVDCVACNWSGNRSDLFEDNCPHCKRSKYVRDFEKINARYEAAKINPTNNEGIELRDYFATQAIQIVYNQIIKECYRPDPDYIASECYKFADAMMEERNNR